MGPATVQGEARNDSRDFRAVMATVWSEAPSSALTNVRRNDTEQVSFVGKTTRLPSMHRTGALRSA